MAERPQLLARIETSVVIGAILVVALFAVATHGQWLSSIPSVLRITAQIGIVAIGQALLMTSGEVDLSVGSVFAFVGVIFIWLTEQMGLGIAPAIALALLAAATIGALNGLTSLFLNVPSMIVTLGSMFIYRGLTYISTMGFSLSIPRELRRDPVVLFLKDRVWNINTTVIILAVLTVLFTFLLAKTRIGSHIRAVGGSTTAALANGVSPVATKLKAFIICSFLAGLSGVLVACQEGSVYSTSGVQMELETIAAAVIGGCTLRGGIGSIWGPVLGVFVLSSLKGGLMMMGAPTSWYIALVGLLLIAFLILPRLLNSRMGVAS